MKNNVFSMFRASAGRLRRRPSAPVIALSMAVFVTVLFSDVLVHGLFFYARDIHFLWYGRVESFVRSIFLGAWPVWDLSVAFGQPLMADSSAQILYPLTWLNLIMRPWTYYVVLVFSHTLFTMVGFYLLARRLGASILGALLGVAAWAASGPLVSSVIYYHHFCGAAWMPWVLLATDRALERGGARAISACALAWAGQILAGSADMCMMTGLLACGFVVTRLSWRAPLAIVNVRALARFGSAIVIAALLTCALLLPLFEITRQSMRSAMPDGVRLNRSVPPLSLAGLLIPLSLSEMPLLPQVKTAWFEEEPLFRSNYLGAFILPLVAIACFSRRGRLTRLFMIVFLLSLAMSLGRFAPAYDAIVGFLPPLRFMRYPEKWLLLSSFCWALLAPPGLDRLRSALAADNRRSLRLPLLLVVVTALLALAAIAILRLSPDVAPRIARLILDPSELSAALRYVESSVAVLAFACLASSIVIAAGMRFSRFSGAAAALLAIAAVCDLCARHRNLHDLAPSSFFTFRPPSLPYLRQDDHRRIYVFEYRYRGKSRRFLGRKNPYAAGPKLTAVPEPLRGSLAYRIYMSLPIAGAFGLESSFDPDERGLYPIPLLRAVTTTRAIEGSAAHLRLLRIGGVGRVVSLHTQGLEELKLIASIPGYLDETIHVFEVPDALPRAYVASNAIVAEDQTAFNLMMSKDFAYKRTVILPEGRPVSSRRPSSGSCRIVTLKPDRVRIQAVLSEPAYVVMADSYDPNWRARIDGKAAHVLRANTIFRAVHAPAGEHDIEFYYRPISILMGLSISAVTACLILAVLSVRPRIP